MGRSDTTKIILDVVPDRMVHDTPWWVYVKKVAIMSDNSVTMQQVGVYINIGTAFD